MAVVPGSKISKLRKETLPQPCITGDSSIYPSSGKRGRFTPRSSVSKRALFEGENVLDHESLQAHIALINTLITHRNSLCLLELLRRDILCAEECIRQSDVFDVSHTFVFNKRRVEIEKYRHVQNLSRL